MTLIGSCSECGGPVIVPSLMVDPVPCCRRCGATMRHPHGPVVPMRRNAVDETRELTDVGRRIDQIDPTDTSRMLLEYANLGYYLATKGTR